MAFTGPSTFGFLAGAVNMNRMTTAVMDTTKMAADDDGRLVE